MPLPFAIDLVMDGARHNCVYVGNGHLEVMFALADKQKVLKLTRNHDQEPEVCQELS